MPQPLHDTRSTQKKSATLKNCMTRGAIFGGLYIASCLLPFLFIGGLYGMVWFKLNMPLSGIAEQSLGLSESTWGLNLLITLINAAIISAIFGGIFYGIHRLVRDLKNPPS